MDVDPAVQRMPGLIIQEDLDVCGGPGRGVMLYMRKLFMSLCEQTGVRCILNDLSQANRCPGEENGF